MSDLICIGFDEKVQKRIQDAANFLEVKTAFYQTSEELFDIAGVLQPRFMIVSSEKMEKKEDIAGEVQVLRQFFPETFLSIVASKKMIAADAQFVKKSGCNYLFLKNEFVNTTRLEYVMLQVVKAAYIPVKVTDLRANTIVNFLVYTIMSLNEKILPVIQPGTVLSEARLAKLATVGELYIKRDQIELYTEYISLNEDKTAQGLTNRCRAQFHSVSYAHANLVLLMTDQAESGSFEQGKILLQKCTALSSNLLTTLAVVPEPWNVIDQSTFGMLGGTDRSMMIAAMAAMTSFGSDLGVAEDVMMAGLFCDLALLDLSPNAIGKIDSLEGRSKLSPDDAEIFKKHPSLSLNCLLERKIQLPDKVKEIILCSHEQSDRKGFPRQVLPEKIPAESTIILFHEFIDLAYRVKLGKQRESYSVIKKRIFDQEYQKPERFNLVFLNKIRFSMES